MEPDEQLNLNNQGKIQARTIETEMETSYLDYAMSVIVSRALPDVRDGLKPVHRRILHVMNLMGLRHTAKYQKSAQVVGRVMGEYHPHGDQAIYDSMVRMAQDFAMRYMMVDGQGNFGSMDGDPPAAYRYTEARMTALAEEMLADIDKDTVDFRPNYDGSQREPVVLPAKLPNLLLNGQIGIAVGMSTNIPPHNLGELVDGVIHLIDNPEASLDDLMQFVKGPDFPTGGILYGIDAVRQAYGTGKGSIVVRAVADVEESKKGDFKIVVTEIPYAVNKAVLVERIADLVKEKKIVGVADLRDESSRQGVRIVIDLKKDAYPKKILNQLFVHTPMQSSFHINMLALVDGLQPRVMSLEMMLKEFIKHREQVVRRRTEFELQKAKDRAHILEGLKLALDDIDAVIATIRASRTAEDAQSNLIKKFKLTVLQARAILSMQLRTLAGLERQKIEDELAELLKLISELEKILASEAEVRRVIKEELTEIRQKYTDARRTKIVPTALDQFSEEELIPNEQVIVTLTAGSYIKRTLASSYRAQSRGGKGISGMSMREEDVIEHMLLTNTHDFLLCFTNLGRVFRLKVHEIPAMLRTAKGQAIVNLLQLQPDEKITSLITLGKDNPAKYLFMATKKGTVKKTALTDYSNVRASGLIAIKLDAGDELGWVRTTDGSNEIIMVTSLGQAMRFNEKDARPMGRATRGVRGIRLRPSDEVVGMDVVQPGIQMLVISELGYGKRTTIDQFTPHARGGVGIKAGAVTDKTGRLIAVRAISGDGNDLVVVSIQGQVIRLPLKGVSLIGRATQGVRVMRLNAGDRVASVALVDEKEIEEEIEEGAQADNELIDEAPKLPVEESTGDEAAE